MTLGADMAMDAIPGRVDCSWRCLVGIAQLLTMDGEGAATAPTEAGLGIVPDAAVLIDGQGVIQWIGTRAAYASADVARGATEVDLGGVVVLPGLVDPHTHLVFAGDRAADFAARCAGETYATIAARGGGIVTTVNATRAADEATLTRLALARLRALAREGVVAVEIKSGYGLSVSDELKQLRVIEALRGLTPQRLTSTLLLHKIPPEYAHAPEAWSALVTTRLLPDARGLADFVDIFVDVGAFGPAEALPLLREARALGYGLKAHTEQLTATGFGADAAGLGATSLEHLEHASDAVLDAMAAAGTVAVLLPGASIFLGDDTRPPVEGMRARGIPMALGTDLNPGSSATSSPWLVATLACTQYGLSPVEAVFGVTRNAARAVGLDGVVGALCVGREASFVTARVPSWLHLFYGLGHHPVESVWIAGRRVTQLGLDLPFA